FDPTWLWFLVSYLAVLIQAVLHAILIANWYTVTTLQAALSVHFLIAAGAVFAFVCALVALIFLNQTIRQVVSTVFRAPRVAWAVRIFTPALLALAAAYAYYVRPLGLSSIPTSAPYFAALANQLASFVRLGWYVTPLGLLLGVVGWMLLSAREINHRTSLLFLIIASDTVIFLYSPDITPIHYWTARRWITLIIPGFALAQAYLFVHIWPKKRTAWSEVALPVALAFALVMGLYSGLRPLLGYVEYRGAIDQVGALAAEIPANGVVLFANGDTGVRFSVPFEYIFDRTSLLITTDARMDQAAGAAARQWLSEGRPVYWITNPGLPDPSEIGLSGTLVSQRIISLPEKIATTAEPPGADGVFQQTVQVWKLRP
ncbi:MAG TPA: hypothetical protein VNG11_04635, partial [Chloroflexota bacterium]|nr:hypothetical protein [Chloroflexota bacterium]